MSCSDRLANHGQNHAWDEYEQDLYYDIPNNSEVCPYCGTLYNGMTDPCCHVIAILTYDMENHYYYCDINDLRSKFHNKFHKIFRKLIKHAEQYKSLNLQSILRSNFDAFIDCCDDIEEFDDIWEIRYNSYFNAIVDDIIIEFSGYNNDGNVDIEVGYYEYGSFGTSGYGRVYWAEDPVAVCSVVCSKTEQVLANHMKQLNELLKTTRVKEAKKMQGISSCTTEQRTQ